MGPLDGYSGGEKPDASTDTGTSDVKIECGTPGYADCNSNLADGCETNIASDPYNCGKCAKVCESFDGGAPSCSSGMCATGKCEGGWDDCDNNPDTGNRGCETNISTSADNCGLCGKKCPSAHATASCEFGACSLTCSTGFADCDSSPTKPDTNGCETDTSTSVQNCGGCNKPCSGGDNATAVCTASKCSLTCNTGFEDCNGQPGDGCEINKNNDVDHCGTCTTQCSDVGGTPSCTNGSCKISCTAPNSNCDNDVKNGCEINLSSDPSHCGTCTTVCPAPAGAVAKCASSTCSWDCIAGTGDCDSNTSNGCETNVTNDATNCGFCGHNCIDSTCENGLCKPLVIASNLNRPAGIVVDATRVFWTDVFDAGTLLVKSKTGGAITTLADFGASEDLAITGDYSNVIWYTLVNIAKIPAPGGTITVVAGKPQVGTASGLAVDLDTVFFLEEGTWSGNTYNKDGTLKRVSVSGGAITPLAGLQDWPVAVAVDANNVYWVNEGTAGALGSIMKVPKTGGAPVEIAKDQTKPCGIAINPSAVFWMVNCNAAVPNGRTLMKVPKSGGSAVALASGVDGSEFLAADDSYVYWTFAGFDPNQSTGTVVKLSVTGGTAPIVLAPGQNHPRGLVVDSLRVYWANSGGGDDASPNGDGSVMSVAK